MLEYSTSMASKFLEGRCFLLQVFVYCHHFTHRGALLVEAPQGLLFPPLLAFLPHQSGNKDCNSCRQGKARLVSWSRHLLSYHTVLVRHNVSSQAPPPLETSSITVFLLEGLTSLGDCFLRCNVFAYSGVFSDKMSLSFACIPLVFQRLRRFRRVVEVPSRHARRKG